MHFPHGRLTFFVHGQLGFRHPIQFGGLQSCLTLLHAVVHCATRASHFSHASRTLREVGQHTSRNAQRRPKKNDRLHGFYMVTRVSAVFV